MLIAQLSDPHLMLPEDPMAGFVDTAARLRAAVGALDGLDPRPDVVLLTGDLVNRGLRREYELAREILAPLDDRLLVIPGNHDDPEQLLDAFADHAHLPGPGLGHMSYVVEDHPIRLIGLDTTVPGRDDGELDDERLAWVEAALEQGPARPTLLFMHHPPVPTGMWWMDYGGLKGRAGLAEVVTGRPEVLRVLAGHVHRAVSAGWAGTVLSTAPSCFYTTTTPVGDPGRPQVLDVPASIPVLRWHDGDGLLIASELDPPGEYRSIDFPDLFGDRWAEYERRARAGAEMPNGRGGTPDRPG